MIRPGLRQITLLNRQTTSRFHNGRKLAVGQTSDMVVAKVTETTTLTLVARTKAVVAAMVRRRLRCSRGQPCYRSRHEAMADFKAALERKP